MGKSRMMGAGHASSSLYKCSPNLPTGGGAKKQGITSRVGLNNWNNREIQTQSNGIGRFKIHFMNQLSGIEPGHSMFGGRWNRADGLQKQLEEDIQNQVILPRQSYVSSTNLTLKRVSEDLDKFIFEASNSIAYPEINSISFNGESVSIKPSSISKVDNKTITVYKNTYTNSINAVIISIQSSQAGRSGNYTWIQT